jgi:hypothetical protein
MRVWAAEVEIFVPQATEETREELRERVQAEFQNFITKLQIKITGACVEHSEY